MFIFLLLLDPNGSMLYIYYRATESSLFTYHSLIGILSFQNEKIAIRHILSELVICSVRFGCVFNALIKTYAQLKLHTNTVNKVRVLVTALFAYLCFLCNAPSHRVLFTAFVSVFYLLTSVHSGFVCVCAFFFIGKYYIEMLMSETFFQSSALLVYDFSSVVS